MDDLTDRIDFNDLVVEEFYKVEASEFVIYNDTEYLNPNRKYDGVVLKYMYDDGTDWMPYTFEVIMSPNIEDSPPIGNRIYFDKGEFGVKLIKL